jgi:hypothetical protein
MWLKVSPLGVIMSVMRCMILMALAAGSVHAQAPVLKVLGVSQPNLAPT